MSALRREPMRRSTRPAGAGSASASLPVIALAACAPGASAAPPAATLAVKYRVGDQQTYRLHEVFTGALAGDSGQVQAVTFDLRAVEATRVTALDPDGIASLEVQLRD